MECLDIPVDHRLTPLIRGMKIPNQTQRSTHLDTLQYWGDLLSKYRKEPIPSTEIYHALELAKPGTKGGVLVVLPEPYRKQTFKRGFSADQRDCLTTRVVCELIETATGGCMSADDVSIFDTATYCPDGTTDKKVLEAARIMFRKLVEAKQPDVTMCCHQNESDEFAKSLSSLGVGKVFPTPHLLLAGTFTTTKRVNAFHPGYAVNRHPTYSCFRRLLLVEFVQAFWYCSGGQSLGEKGGWVKKLRADCESLAQSLSSRPESEEEQTSSRTVDENRWENILSPLDEKLKGLDYFNGDITVDTVVDSELSWLCTDASLFLAEFEKEGKSRTECRGVSDTLLDYFSVWCQSKYAGIAEPGIERSNQRGFFKPSDLWKAPLHIIHEEGPARGLHAHFSAFMNDLNFSFSWEGYPKYTCDTVAQRNAFRRFAANLERSFVRKDDCLAEAMRGLDI